MYGAEVETNHLSAGRALDTSVPLPDGAGMPSHLALPEDGSGPGVLVIPDRYGRTPFYEKLAHRIAGLGYVAACCEPFHRMDPLDSGDSGAVAGRRAESDEVVMLADLDHALTWLKERPEVAPTRVGVVGFCMGGTLALNLSAMRRDLATVCFYGFPAGSRVAGRAVPAPLDIVDDIAGPLIGFWGEDDPGIAMSDVDALLQSLCARKIACFSVTYPHVGHGFMAEDPADERTIDAARHAWARMSAFLKRHLADA